MDRIADDDARLLERFTRGANGGLVSVQHAGAGLDCRERSVAQIGSGAKLLDQHDDLALRVIEQHSRRFAVTVDFMAERARRVVVLSDLDLGAGQIEPAGGQNRLTDHARGFGHLARLIAELFAQDLLIERVAWVMQENQ